MIRATLRTDYFRKFLAEHHLTVAGFARRAGIPPSYMRSLLRPGAFVGPHTRGKIVRGLVLVLRSTGIPSMFAYFDEKGEAL